MICAVSNDVETTERGVTDWRETTEKFSAALPEDTMELEVQYSDDVLRFRQQAREHAVVEERKNWVDRERDSGDVRTVGVAHP